MIRGEGLEPPTSSVSERRSPPLSYPRVTKGDAPARLERARMGSKPTALLH